MLKYFFSALLMLTAVMVSAPASAKDDHNAIYNCEYTGIVNVYAELGENVEIPVGTPPAEFHEYDCDRGNMRIYKTIGNSELEWIELKTFARNHAYKNYPEAVCGDADRSRLVSLSHFYYKKYYNINTAEQNNYKDWITQYVDNRPACKLFATDEVYNGG